MDNDQTTNSGTPPYMSRRERRELMRSQKDSGTQSRFPASLRRFLIWGGSIVVIALIGWGMVKLSQRGPLANGGGNLSVAVGSQDNIRGPVDATITLVEYSDFQCPACGAFYPIVKRVFEEPELKDHIRFVYRYFPLTMHANAQIASQAAQAAALQGKFWEMHDLLFDKQETWADLSDSAARSAFTGYAQQLGLDKNRFLSDIDSASVKDRVKDDVNSGNSSGVNSTPTFYVNGKFMSHPQSYDEFKQNLINALNATE